MNAYFKRRLDMAAKEGVTEYKFVRDGAAFPAMLVLCQMITVPMCF